MGYISDAVIIIGFLVMITAFIIAVYFSKKKYPAKIARFKGISVWRITFIILPLILFTILTVIVLSNKFNATESIFYQHTIKIMSPCLTMAMKITTDLGGPIGISALLLILLAVPRYRVRYGIPVTAAVIISLILNAILKEIFVRERPDILQLIIMTDYSYPSGHAMTNMTLYTVLLFLILRYVEDKRLRAASLAICGLLTMLIGFSRVYLGVHYLGDIVAGWLLGFSVGLIIYTVIEIIFLNKKWYNSNKKSD